MPELLSIISTAHELIQAIRTAPDKPAFVKAAIAWQLQRDDWVCSQAEFAGVELPIHLRGRKGGREYQLALAELLSRLHSGTVVEQYLGLDSRIGKIWDELRYWSTGTIKSRPGFLRSKVGKVVEPMLREMKLVMMRLEEFMASYEIPYEPLQNQPAPQSPAMVPTPARSKKSTRNGDGRARLIACLTNHHQYSDGSCLNLEPIGNNKLAKAANVVNSTASEFFRKEFDGHLKYKARCRDSISLIASLKLLNNEYAPHHLFGTSPRDLSTKNADDLDDR